MTDSNGWSAAAASPDTIAQSLRIIVRCSRLIAWAHARTMPPPTHLRTFKYKKKQVERIYTRYK